MKNHIDPYIPYGVENAKRRAVIIEEMAVDGFIICDAHWRKIVKKKLRDKESLICSTSHGGYYRPRNDHDLVVTVREDDSRISRLIADREAKISMAEEMGIVQPGFKERYHELRDEEKREKRT